MQADRQTTLFPPADSRARCAMPPRCDVDDRHCVVPARFHSVRLLKKQFIDSFAALAAAHAATSYISQIVGASRHRRKSISAPRALEIFASVKSIGMLRIDLRNDWGRFETGGWNASTLCVSHCDGYERAMP